MAVLDLPIVQIPAILSFCGAFWIILSWVCCTRWRKKVEAGKLILLMIGICDLIAAANYFNGNALDTRTTCMIQSLVMQTFEISSWNFNAALAWEVHFLVTSPTSVILRDVHRIYRHACYHIIIWGFAAIAVIVAVVENVWGAAGAWCWLKVAIYRIGFGYVPLWIGFAIIIYCNTNVIKMVYESDAVKNGRSVSGGDKRQRLLFKAGVMRLLIVPLAFIVLHLPGTCRRIMEAAQYDGVWYLTIGTIQDVCDPSQGSVTALVYLAMDTELRREWWYILNGKHKEYQSNATTYSNTTSPPTQEPRSSEQPSDQRPSFLNKFVNGEYFRNSAGSSKHTSLGRPSQPFSHRFHDFVDVDDVTDDELRPSKARDSSV